jgi:hypothetical protein
MNIPNTTNTSPLAGLAHISSYKRKEYVCLSGRRVLSARRKRWGGAGVPRVPQYNFYIYWTECHENSHEHLTTKSSRLYTPANNANRGDARNYDVGVTVDAMYSILCVIIQLGKISKQLLLQYYLLVKCKVTKHQQCESFLGFLFDGHD